MERWIKDWMQNVRVALAYIILRKEDWKLMEAFVSYKRQRDPGGTE